MRYIYQMMLGIVLVGCGYKPLAHIATNNIRTAHIQIEPNWQHPNIYMDTLNALTRGLEKKFFTKIIDDPEKSDLVVKLSLKQITSDPIKYNSGFVSKSRITVKVNFQYKLKTVSNEWHKKTITSSYDFNSQEIRFFGDSHDEQELQSILKAINMSIDRFIVSLIGLSIQTQ